MHEALLNFKHRGSRLRQTHTFPNAPRIAIPLLLVIISFQGVSQNPPAPRGTANVTVTAVDGFGSPAHGNFWVDSFINERGRDRAALFRKGQVGQPETSLESLAKLAPSPTASGVPFGKYRITVRSSDYWNSTFLVEVDAPNVLITVGLEWPGVENGRITGRLQGKLAGFPPAWSDWWCKALGLYSRLDYESAVTSSDLHFDFNDVPPGVYVVTCVANRKFIAVRTVRVAADAVPFTIDYKPNEDREAVTTERRSTN